MLEVPHGIYTKPCESTFGCDYQKNRFVGLNVMQFKSKPFIFFHFNGSSLTLTQGFLNIQTVFNHEYICRLSKAGLE